MTTQQAHIIFIPHGGGPLPLLNEPGHAKMVDFLRRITKSFEKPDAILVISAHWEEDTITITSGGSPELIYDYYGFPEETYNINYLLKGEPVLASKIHSLLERNGIESVLNAQRGFDHGVFVPLKIMYPDADIPCVQLSLNKNLEAKTHLNIGKALAELKNDNVLVLGSGFSFHNLRAFSPSSGSEVIEKNEAFENWLVDTCTNESFSQAEREERLVNWIDAPHARYCHPREEHLLPLHVCAGMGGTAAELVFHDKVLGIKTSAFQW